MTVVIITTRFVHALLMSTITCMVLDFVIKFCILYLVSCILAQDTMLMTFQQTHTMVNVRLSVGYQSDIDHSMCLADTTMRIDVGSTSSQRLVT